MQAINAGRGWDAAGSRTSRFYTSQRRRILNAARPVLNNIRAMVEARIGPVDINWVKAHTGGTDIPSVRNESADVGANVGRVTSQPSHGLAGENKVSLLLRRWATGSYRRTILQEAKSAALARLAAPGGRTHQFGLANSCGRALLHYCEVVRRANDNDLTSFAILAVTQWLPTEFNFVKRHGLMSNLPHARGGSCKLCGAPEESTSHAILACRGHSGRVWRSATAARAIESLNKADGLDLQPDAEGPAIMVPAFFDPTGQHHMALCPRVSLEARASLANHDPLAGFLGIMPAHIDEILSWARVVGGGWRRCSPGEAQDRITSLRFSLLWGGLRVWQARCRAMDKWIRSDAAQSYRHSLAVEAVDRAGKKASTADRKNRARHSRDNPPQARSSRYEQRSLKAMTRTYVSHPCASAIRDTVQLDSLMEQEETRQYLAEVERLGKRTVPRF